MGNSGKEESEVKQREPQIDCLKIEKPSRMASDLPTIVVIILTVVLVIFTALVVPSHYFPIAIIGIVAAVLACLFIYLWKGEDKITAKMRHRTKSFVYGFIFLRLLQLDRARTEFAIWYYNNRLERFSSTSFRKAFLQFNKPQIETKLSPSLKPKFPLEVNQAEIKWLFRSDMVYWNNVIYRLESIEKSELGLSLTFGPGCYFDYVATCESIGRELDIALRNHPLRLLKRRLKSSDSELESFYRDIRRSLPLRTKYASSRETLERPVTKCLKMGTNNVTLLYDEREKLYRFLLGRRSERILEYPGTYHVVPAGTFEPSGKKNFYDALESSPVGNVLRELYEECFQGAKNEECDENSIPTSELVNEVEEINFIYSRLNNPAMVEFKIMDVYIDIITPKVEMTTCLVVHDASYLKELETNQKLVLNWEYGSELLKIPFIKSELDQWIGSRKMLPIGSVALQDAMKHFAKLLH